MGFRKRVVCSALGCLLRQAPGDVRSPTRSALVESPGAEQTREEPSRAHGSFIHLININ